MDHPANVRIQGTLKGGSPQPQGTVKPSALKAQLGVDSPRDNATGQSTGKRQHEPLKITAKGACSSLLAHAYLTKKPLDTVVVDLVGPTSPGTGRAGSTLTLHDVVVSQIVKHADHSDTEELTEIEFTFQRIEHTNSQGGKTGSDDWTR
jgi:type VI secretion system Hcp family effector